MSTDNGIELLAYRPQAESRHKPHCGDVTYILLPGLSRGMYWGVAIRGENINQLQVAPDILERDFERVQVTGP